MRIFIYVQRNFTLWEIGTMQTAYWLLRIHLGAHLNKYYYHFIRIQTINSVKLFIIFSLPNNSDLIIFTEKYN